MGLFDWLTKPKGTFLYIDDQKRQHHLTAEQYGEKCVFWAVPLGGIKVVELGLYGKDKMATDILSKVRRTEVAALAHATAFLVAVYSTYPAIRLGAALESYEKILGSVRNMILNKSHFLLGHPNSVEYRQLLISDINQYCATILEAAGTAGLTHQDPMLVGVGNACHRLFNSLEQEYSQIPAETDVVDESSSEPMNPTVENWFTGTFKNPAAAAAYDVDSRKLILSVFFNSARQFIEATDSDHSLILAS